eukprot:3618769-Rhodomonas_salina.2
MVLSIRLPCVCCVASRATCAVPFRQVQCGLTDRGWVDVYACEFRVVWNHASPACFRSFQQCTLAQLERSDCALVSCNWSASLAMGSSNAAHILKQAWSKSVRRLVCLDLAYLAGGIQPPSDDDDGVFQG